jgi:hypothetical protein
MAKSTMESWHGRKVSPVYHLLRYLREPDWKSLRVDEAKEFWEKQEAWETMIKVAREKQRPGDLNFRPNEVEAAIKIFSRDIEKVKKPETRRQYRSVFLFSGHMIDAPGRKEQRFPNEKNYIELAAKAIAIKLDELDASKEDLAMCGGACGGDLLFAESCLERGLSLEIRIPYEEPTFLRKSVSFAGDVWVDRFYKVKNHPNTKLCVMPDEIGPAPKGVDAYARNNLWQLYTALSMRPEIVRFICLWNGMGGDGPGGTKDMYDQISNHLGRAYVLDTNELFKK